MRVRKEVAEAIGLKKLSALLGVDAETWSWASYRDVDLSEVPPGRLPELERLYRAVQGRVRAGIGARSNMNDVAAWRSILAGKGDARARKPAHAAALLVNHLRPAGGHRVYERVREDVYVPYYVNEVAYVPKKVSREYTIPEHVNVRLIWVELGGRRGRTLRFQDDDLRGFTAAQVLARRSFFAETKELRDRYLEERAAFEQLQPQVGLQLECRGLGTDDLDGNGDDDDDRYWRRSVKTFRLGADDDPGRCVVDVFHELPSRDDESRNEKGTVPDPSFWKRRSSSIRDDDDDDDDDDVDENADDNATGDDAPVIEIPLHPFLATFHLGLHLRLRVHVRDVEPHAYDRGLGDRLILPAEQKALVKILVEHRAGGFRDLVRGKSGGAVVLLAGPPGTGKTLTAEVYAEAEERALYSVQCSQLGVEPADLEKALGQCFDRASRWNAVMLLDEADVYVHRRGDDLVQNAIVGVFLRVLEYQQAVLFLTTNRPDDVDDAVASRCVARIVYGVPSPGDQARIWRVLAEVSGTELSDRDVRAIVRRFPALTGRDVKNLLKLARLYARGRAVTARDVEFVERFKPTQDVGGK